MVSSDIGGRHDDESAPGSLQRKQDSERIGVMTVTDWDPCADALNQHDSIAAASLFLPGGVHEDATAHVRSESHEAIRKFVEIVAEESSHCRAALVGPPIITDNAHAVEWGMGGTDGPSRPVRPATGKKYDRRSSKGAFQVANNYLRPRGPRLERRAGNARGHGNFLQLSPSLARRRESSELRFR